MIIMKFGGASIQDANGIRRIVEIVNSRYHLQPVLVISAMGKSTRKLLQIAQKSAVGDLSNARTELDLFIQYHENIVKELLPEFSESDLIHQLLGFFDELVRLTNGINVVNDLTPKIQDKFLAYGELIATTVITATLQSNNISAVWCDARKMIITDDRFTQAQPNVDITYIKIIEQIMPLIQNEKIPVIQGYIGSTRDGATTTLGFEGSDFTAALVGAALEASDIQIWKDVPGVMTTDPEIYPHAHTVRYISFDEAAEITFFGAKVLHPSSISPAKQKNIPVHVLNSRIPDSIGTELSHEYIIAKNRVKSITYRRPIVLMNIRNKEELHFYDFFKAVFDALDRERLTPYLVNISERSMTVALGSSANLQHLIDDLSNVSYINILPNKATVSMIGQGLLEYSDTIIGMFSCLTDAHLDLVSYGASNKNITIVIDANNVEKVVKELHEHFFKEYDSNVFI